LSELDSNKVILTAGQIQGFLNDIKGAIHQQRIQDCSVAEASAFVLGMNLVLQTVEVALVRAAQITNGDEGLSGNVEQSGLDGSTSGSGRRTGECHVDDPGPTPGAAGIREGDV
jgi:hypothetical protein